MPATPEDLFAFLEGMGIKTETITHPAVFTVEESKRLRGEIPGAHVKNLFIKDKKGNLFIISALEDTRIDLKTIHEVIGGSGRVSFLFRRSIAGTSRRGAWLGHAFCGLQ